MRPIDERILNYCGIYNRPEVDKETIKDILKKKDDIEKLTGVKVEKIYLFGESYWGKNPKRKFETLCFLADARISVLNEIHYKLEEYNLRSNRKVMLWSLGQFEKRCQYTRELDYYIAQYGALIYDSGKQTELDESVMTQYASTSNNFKEYVKKYLDTDEDGILMQRLLEVYILKIGYHIPLENVINIIEYAEYVTEDENVKKFLEEYKKAVNIQDRTKICNKFELYLKNEVKEHTRVYTLKELPTMKVYEKLEKQFQENGPLDIKTLTKDDLYTMYVLQKKNAYDIARLYNVSTRKITDKRSYWNIKLKEEVISIENIKELMAKEVKKHSKNFVYESFERAGLLSFKECIIPILKFMRSGETFLLKEFWRFTEFEKNNFENELTGKNTTTWYRATYCLEFLKDNGLVCEIDFKKYRITKKGKEIIGNYLSYEYKYKDSPIEEFLIKRLKKINLFEIIYEDESEFIYFDEQDINFQYEENEELETEDFELILGHVEETKKEEIDIEEQINNIKQITYVKKEKRKVSNSNRSRKIKRDYVKEAEAKTEFGKKCEKIIYEKEKRDFINQGRKDLADKVEWVSQEPGGDSKGYDIISFRKINNEYEQIYIEVKGTNKDYDEDFEISALEVETSEKYKDKYYICRVAKANTKHPIYYEQNGSLRENYDLKPTTYRATKKV